MGTKKIKELKRGEFFKRSEHAQRVYIKGDYDRATKSFSCIAYDDINQEIFIKANKEVFIDFIF